MGYIFSHFSSCVIYFLIFPSMEVEATFLGQIGATINIQSAGSRGILFQFRLNVCIPAPYTNRRSIKNLIGEV